MSLSSKTKWDLCCRLNVQNSYLWCNIQEHPTIKGILQDMIREKVSFTSILEYMVTQCLVDGNSDCYKELYHTVRKTEAHLQQLKATVSKLLEGIDPMEI